MNAVQCTDAVKQIHGGAGCHIEIVQRLLKNGDAVIHTGWRRFALRYQQVLVFAGDGDEGILAVVVHGKFLGVFQRHVSRGGTVCPGAAGGGLRRSRSAGKEQHTGQQQTACSDPAHHCFSSVAESKYRVYSISWGVLMAVVSAETGMA